MTIKFVLRRLILFSTDMETMSKFYGDIIGLELVASEDGWRDFKAGACNIALHEVRSTIGNRPPKLVVYAKDVAAARVALVRRGVKTMGKIISTGKFDMCDGKDLDGNSFQLSARLD